MLQGLKGQHYITGMFWYDMDFECQNSQEPNSQPSNFNNGTSGAILQTTRFSSVCLRSIAIDILLHFRHICIELTFNRANCGWPFFHQWTWPTWLFNYNHGICWGRDVSQCSLGLFWGWAGSWWRLCFNWLSRRKHRLPFLLQIFKECNGCHHPPWLLLSCSHVDDVFFFRFLVNGVSWIGSGFVLLIVNPRLGDSTVPPCPCSALLVAFLLLGGLWALVGLHLHCTHARKQTLLGDGRTQLLQFQVLHLTLQPFLQDVLPPLCNILLTVPLIRQWFQVRFLLHPLWWRWPFLHTKRRQGNRPGSHHNWWSRPRFYCWWSAVPLSDSWRAINDYGFPHKSTYRWCRSRRAWNRWGGLCEALRVTVWMRTNQRPFAVTMCSCAFDCWCADRFWRCLNRGCGATNSVQTWLRLCRRRTIPYGLPCSLCWSLHLQGQHLASAGPHLRWHMVSHLSGPPCFMLNCCLHVIDGHRLVRFQSGKGWPCVRVQPDDQDSNVFPRSITLRQILEFFCRNYRVPRFIDLFHSFFIGYKAPEAVVGDDDKFVIVSQNHSGGVGVRNDIGVEVGATKQTCIPGGPTDFGILQPQQKRMKH